MNNEKNQRGLEALAGEVALHRLKPLVQQMFFHHYSLFIIH
jgi:hypothetical protein